MKHKFHLAVFLLSVFIFFSPAVYASKRYEEGKIYRHSLSNGLLVITMERHITPAIFHEIIYRVGSRNEHLGITGISHIVEHMMFKGTKKFTKGQAIKQISENSGLFNGFTSNDMTGYFEYMPKNKIETALDVESDRMQNCLFDEDEFKKEISVIKQERRMRSESDASGVMNENINSVAYESHPNRDPIIGWPCDIESMTREDAVNYYKTYYTPNNAFLVLVGDFDTVYMLKLVQKHYGPIPKGPEIKDKMFQDQPQRLKKTLTLHHNDIEAPLIQMAFHVPSVNNRDGAALKLVASILGRDKTSRLTKKLVEDLQIASSVSSWMPISKDPPLFRINVYLKKGGKIEECESIIWEELRKLKEVQVSRKELEKAKNQFLYSSSYDYLSNMNVSSKLSMFEAYYGLAFLDEYPGLIMKTTEEDIKNVMQKYFTPDKATICYAYPKENASSKRAKEKIEEELQSEGKTKYIYDRNFYDGKDMSGSTGDIIIKPKQIAPMIKENRLKNGIAVYTVETPMSPFVYIRGLFDTGFIPEAAKKQGIINLLAATMNRGPKDRSSKELSERMSFVPFSFNVGGSFTNILFSGQSLKKDADELFETGFEMLSQPGFREPEIEKSRNMMIDRVKKRNTSTGELASFTLFKHIFEKHPYVETESTEKSIASITKDDLVKVHRKYMVPACLKIIVAGDMNHKDLLNFAEKYFGKWKPIESVSPKAIIPPVENLTKKELIVFPDNDYTECTVNVGFAPSNDIAGNTRETVDVLNYILASGNLTSRLYTELRDKRGLIYGLGSQLWSTSDKIGYWKFQTKTSPKNTEEVIKIIFSEIRKILQSDITDEELATAKRRLLGLLAFRIETPEDIVSTVYNMVLNSEPLNFFDKKADRISRVTKDDVYLAAKKYLTPERFIIIIDGPVNEKTFEGLKEKL